jgi:hypothetical protein
MDKVVLDRPMQTALEGAASEVELCDDAGKTLGYFVPPKMHRMLYDWAFSLFDNSEELEAARQEPGGMTTAEAVAHIEKVAEEQQRKKP